MRLLIIVTALIWADFAAAQTINCRRLPDGGLECDNGQVIRPLPGGGYQSSDGQVSRPLPGGGMQIEPSRPASGLLLFPRSHLHPGYLRALCKLGRRSNRPLCEKVSFRIVCLDCARCSIHRRATQSLSNTSRLLLARKQLHPKKLYPRSCGTCRWLVSRSLRAQLSRPSDCYRHLRYCWIHLDVVAIHRQDDEIWRSPDGADCGECSDCYHRQSDCGDQRCAAIARLCHCCRRRYCTTPQPLPNGSYWSHRRTTPHLWSFHSLEKRGANTSRERQDKCKFEKIERRNSGEF